MDLQGIYGDPERPTGVADRFAARPFLPVGSFAPSRAIDGAFSHASAVIGGPLLLIRPPKALCFFGVVPSRVGLSGQHYELQTSCRLPACPTTTRNAEGRGSDAETAEEAAHEAKRAAQQAALRVVER
jgi:hypothetical protein